MKDEGAAKQSVPVLERRIAKQLDRFETVIARTSNLLRGELAKLRGLHQSLIFKRELVRRLGSEENSD